MRGSRGKMSSAFSRVIGTVVVLSALSCQPEIRVQLTEEQAQAIASQYLEARNTPDLNLLDNIYAPDVVVHDCSAPEDLRGLGALKAFYEGSHTGFPDLQVHIDDVLVAENQIIWRWTIDGTHTGILRGIPPTGRHVSFSGVAIDRIEGEKIVEEWVYFNVLDLLEQLGLMPSSPAATPPGA